MLQTKGEKSRKLRNAQVDPTSVVLLCCSSSSVEAIATNEVGGNPWTEFPRKQYHVIFSRRPKRKEKNIGKKGRRGAKEIEWNWKLFHRRVDSGSICSFALTQVLIMYLMSLDVFLYGGIYLLWHTKKLFSNNSSLKYCHFWENVCMHWNNFAAACLLIGLFKKK